MKQFKQVVENRRSIEVLDRANNISQAEIVRRIEHALFHAPSAFNAQSASVMVLFDDSHHQLWDEVLRQILPFVPKDKQAKSIQKIEGFKGGSGTIVFLEDTEVSEQLKAKFPLYQDNVSLWADQGQGFAQYAVWLALSEAGLSANLQHYNPLIDPFIMDNYNLDKKYQVVAQMPFGLAKSNPKPNKKKPIEKRVFIR